jgi:hypothetical protein
MDVQAWLSRTRSNIARRGLSGIQDSLYEVYYALLRNAMRPFISEGEPIYESDWDVLIVLDGCRLDEMKCVASEYECVQSIDSTISPGSMSAEWMKVNFSERYAAVVAETAYVTGNPYSREILEESRFYLMDEVWKYAWDEDLGTVRPRPMTDRAIHVYQNQDPERMIVHYMQPHYPFLEDPSLDAGINKEHFGNQPPDNVWKALQRGELSSEVVRAAYRRNLRAVLDDVAVLVANLDADSVILTADHGNSFGEYGVYGHPAKMRIPSIVEVPWCELSSNDTDDYDPATYDIESRISVEDRLSALGYK